MDKLTGIVWAYQSPALWRNLFELADQRRRALEHGPAENAEILRQAILGETAKLLRVKDYCRQHAPAVLAIVPNVDPFDAQEHDCNALADRMVQVEAALLAAEQSGEATEEAPAATESDWILASEAVAQVPFIGSLKALYKFAEENPGKLRLRPHPTHPQRRQAHAADVLRLQMEYADREFDALGRSRADDLPSVSDRGMEALAERMARERGKKDGRK